MKAPQPTTKPESELSTDRIFQSLKARDSMYGGSKDVSKYDVACVLKALADHTLIMEMIEHRPDPSSPWPEATSVGRWFHDAADKLFDEAQLSHQTKEGEDT